ncbi:MAG: dephospho-CoA kinase [Alphaproteobacteria bacterium]
MIIAGLTGSIGMGKSTASNMLREMGVPIHDSDATVHELMGKGGKAVAAIAALCPECHVDGGIDRKILGKYLFADPALKQAVEDVLFPLVKQSAVDFIALKKTEGHALAVLDVPLLFEAGWDKMVDKVICVSAPPEVQKARVMARPGMTEERFNAVLKAQMSDADKRAKSDFIIDTGVGMDDTRAQLKKLVDTLRPAARPNPPGIKP